jgi:plastocyanin
VAAGPAVFTFTNTGVENHEIGLVKIKQGVTAAQAIAKAKADPEDQSYIEGFLGAAYALKGEHTDLSVKLEPGLYGYGCFVKDPKGTPHAASGMISTFTVR